MKTFSWDELDGEINENLHDAAQADADEGWEECGKILSNGRHYSLDVNAASQEEANALMVYIARAILESLAPDQLKD
jgi:hypothetical protein